MLVRRLGFSPRQSAKVLIRRLAAREEHHNPNSIPHHPSCEPRTRPALYEPTPPLLCQDTSGMVAEQVTQTQ